MNTAQPRSRWFLWAGVGGVVALALALAITLQVTSTTESTDTSTFINVFIVNLLVGLSVVLFVAETGRGALRAVLTVAAALLIGFLILFLINTDPVSAYINLLGGPLSLLSRWGNWINDALSLTLVGLAIVLVFRAQLFSLGAEGQIYFGALAAGYVALFVPGLPAAIHIPLAMAAGGLAGFLWGLLPGVLRAYLGANELVSTLMLNPIAVSIYELILQALKVPGASAVVSPDFPQSAQLPRIVPDSPATTAVFYGAAAVLLTWLIIQRTPLGYEICMIGANVRFARYGGINTRRAIVLSMAVSGILAGVTGAALVLGIHRRLRLGISTNLAFDGIVVALLARNKPLAIPAMALLYAYLRTGGDVMQSQANISSDIVRVIEAIIILLITAEALVDTFKWFRGRHTPTVEGPQSSVSLEVNPTVPGEK